MEASQPSMMWAQGLKLAEGEPPGSVDSTVEHVKTRPIAKTDYADVSRIYRGAVEEYLAWLGKTRSVQELRTERRSMRLTLPHGLLDFYSKFGSSFVATSGGNTIGFVLTQPIRWMNMDSKVLWLEYIAVEPAFRSRGVGSLLLATAKKWADRRGIHYMFTILNSNNEPSRTLLLKNRFEVRKWMTARYPSS